MPYWNADLHGCDFAFDSVGVIVLQTVERLETEADLVIEKQYPEQSMLALLRVLDLLIDEFPKCVSVHFGKRKYLAVRDKYFAWRKSSSRIPETHIGGFDENATALFDRLDRKLKIGDPDVAQSGKDTPEQ